MKMLYIIRGIPGSGKSTLAKKIASVACEVDGFFVDPDGVYRFDPSLLKEAHSACQKKCVTAMQFEVDAIAVADTFTRKWEYPPYINLAKEYGYKVSVIICEGDFGNVHGVPEETVCRMRERFQF